MKLELGCGNMPTPGYLHQDVHQQDGIKLDFVCAPWEIPLPENTLDEILGLAMMEHLRFAEVEWTLAHLYKILKPGGAFLFDVPDMTIWAEYLYNATHGLEHLNPLPTEHVWRTVYGWQRWEGDEHKSGWTRDSILTALNRAGFDRIGDGVQIFTDKGIQRGRFTRPGDAHLYLKAQK